MFERKTNGKLRETGQTDFRCICWRILILFVNVFGNLYCAWTQIAAPRSLPARYSWVWLDVLPVIQTHRSSAYCTLRGVSHRHNKWSCPIHLLDVLILKAFLSSFPGAGPSQWSANSQVHLSAWNFPDRVRSCLERCIRCTSAHWATCSFPIPSLCTWGLCWHACCGIDSLVMVRVFA